MKGYFVSGGYIWDWWAAAISCSPRRATIWSIGRLTHGAGSPTHTLPSQGHAPMGWQTGGVLWKKRAVLKNYGLQGAMLAAMLTGGVTEAGCGLPPPGPSGTLGPSIQGFCVVVPAGVLLHRRSHRRDAERPPGRGHHGRTVLTFVVTGIPRRRADVPVDEGISRVQTPWQSLTTEAVGGPCRPPVSCW